MSPLPQTNSTASQAEARRIGQITDRLRNATERVGPGRYSISSRSAATAHERQALTRRVDELRRGIEPAGERDVAETVLKFMAGYPSLRLSRDEAAAMTNAFVAQLRELPLWAIRRVLRQWGQLEGSNPTFPPSAPALKVQAERLVRHLREQIGNIEIVLNAQVEEAPSEEERAKAIARWFEVIRPTMQHVNVSRMGDGGRAEQLRANERIREREEALGVRKPAGGTTNNGREINEGSDLSGHERAEAAR